MQILMLLHKQTINDMKIHFSLEQTGKRSLSVTSLLLLQKSDWILLPQFLMSKACIADW